jgi:ribosomal RNA-processing protein 9
MIRLWQIDDRVRSFSLLTTVPALGYINSLQLICPSLRSEAMEQNSKKKEEGAGGKALIVIAGTAKEPRLGRWMRMTEGKEGATIVVIPLGAANIPESDRIVEA